MYKFRQFLTKLSACDRSIVSFTDDNLTKYRWIFTKFGICIDIVAIWFRIANGQISSILTEVSASNTSIFSFSDDKLSKYELNGLSSNLVCALTLWRSDLGLLMGSKFCQFLTELSAPDTSRFSFQDNNISKYK